MTDLNETGLTKRAVTALVEQGIDSIAKLCSFSLDDIEQLEGIGPAAMIQIAKIKEANASAAPTPAPEPAKPEPKYMTEEPPESERTPTTRPFTINVQFRHAEWITRAAKVYGMTEEQVIEQAIRQAYQHDPYKAGDTAVSGSILKHDNVHNPNRNE